MLFQDTFRKFSRKFDILLGEHGVALGQHLKNLEFGPYIGRPRKPAGQLSDRISEPCGALKGSLLALFGLGRRSFYL